jgi:hypothetical protein
VGLLELDVGAVNDGARPHQFHRKEYAVGVRFHPTPTKQNPSLVETGHMFVPDEVDDYYQAMMEDRPLLEFDANPEIWERVSEILDETEMAVIEMTVISGLTLRETGELLARERGRPKPYGKAWMQTVRDRAMDKLRKAFLEETP